MPLAKRKKGEKATLPEGVTARVELAPFRVAQAGIKTAEVGYAPLTQTLTTVGYVAFDERRMANIVSKVPGKTRVEKLYVNFTGQDVEVGQTLAELYSPELSQAIQELLNAARRAEQAVRPQTAVGRSLVADRREMVRASAEKLRRWGITQAQIDEILKQGQDRLHDPDPLADRRARLQEERRRGPGGAGRLRDVRGRRPAHRLGPGPGLRASARAWSTRGRRSRRRVEAFPGETFPGKVEFIQPHLDPATRTVEVRFALDNPGHRLRPGMFATVTLKTPSPTRPTSGRGSPRPTSRSGDWRA